MYLLDTDTVIYGLKGVPAVVENMRRRRASPMALSVVTYGELVFGAEKSEKRTQNLASVHRVAELYPILPVTRAIMDTFGPVKAELHREGERIDDFDLLVAATALVHGLTLVTNNTRHFERVEDLAIENWTTAP
jgi:tRNA(fMet)-specific endonuclease VapC